MIALLIPLLAPVAGFFTFFGIFLLMVGLGGSRRADPLEQRLNDAARGSVMSLDDQEMQASFYDRFFRPLAAGMARGLARFTPVQSLESTQKRLLNAGLMGQMQVSDFIGLKGLGTLGGAAVAGLLIVITHSGTLMSAVLILVFAGLGYVFPDLWLRSKTSQRKTAIANALPDSIDLLTISVEAGLGFDQALARIVSKADNLLTREFARVLQQMRLGVARRDALRELVDRTGVEDLSQFVGAIIQAEQLGASIGRVLRIQSAEMRVRRRQRAQRLAQQAPIKMLFPMAFLILPSIFVVVLGPAVPRIVHAFAPGAPL
ncbi:MAG TPA: type II secretion system F family protein [Ktedonobacterales bacterium]|nr:type II secretion system F family protein [Ktedonobacterales bacterium]